MEDAVGLGAFTLPLFLEGIAAIADALRNATDTMAIKDLKVDLMNS